MQRSPQIAHPVQEAALSVSSLSTSLRCHLPGRVISLEVVLSLQEKGVCEHTLLSRRLSGYWGGLFTFHSVTHSWVSGTYYSMLYTQPPHVFCIHCAESPTRAPNTFFWVVFVLLSQCKCPTAQYDGSIFQYQIINYAERFINNND